MKILFDFDHTLFASGKLLEAVQKLYGEHGVAPDVFFASYEESRQGKRDWKPDVQLAMLHEEAGITIETAKRGLYEIVKGARQFLYEDSLPVLERLRRNHDLYVVSYGEDAFQKAKIQGAGIWGLFKEVFITDDITKVTPLSRILDKEGKGAVFVEDNPLALVECKKQFPFLTTVRINRGEGRYAEELDDSSFNFVIKNLEELEKIVART